VNMSLLDLELKVVEVAHVGLDLVEWQLDQHTRDLWCLFVTDQLLDVLVNSMSNLVLKMWVLWRDGWDVLGGIKLILLGHGHLGWVDLVLHHVWLDRHWLLNHSLVSLWHWVLTWLSWHHWLWLITSHHTWLLWHLLSLMHWLLSWTSLVVAWSLSWRSIVVVSWLSWSVDLNMVHLLVRLLVILDDTEQLLEHLSQMRPRSQIVPFESTALGGLVPLPISLVTSLFHMKLSDLLDLVVVDHEHLVVNGVVLQILLGLCSISWLLEADEGVGVASRSASVAELDVLDLTEGLEEVSQVVFGVAVREVLHEQVASLLGSLVSNGLAHLLDLALSLLQG